jgi:non-canonical purine NTP pyrophosphatase (RdgB/HAM1 family)
MQDKIVFLTGNKGKLKEATAIVGELITPWKESIDLPEIQSTNPQEVLQAKIEAAKSALKASVIVEDTSLFLTDWGTGDLPGPYIKDFLKTLNPSGLCELGQAVGSAARAITVLGFYDRSSDETHFFTGELKGEIATSPRGDNGFGWDPVFIPAGQDRTIAEMSDEEKNTISMRKQAFEKLSTFLGK